MLKENKECLILDFADLDTNPDYTYRWCFGDTLLHEHTDFYEIVFITSGDWLHDFQNSTECVKAGNLLIFDVKQRHRLRSLSSSAIHFTLCLSPNYFRALMNFFPSAQNIFQKKQYYLSSLDDISFSYLLMITNQLQKENTSAEFDKVKLFFYNALSFLAPSIIQLEETEYSIANDIYVKLKNLSFLTLSMSDIYKQYPCSVPTIIKQFKQLVGVTPVQFQTSIRLEQAARQLCESPLSIEEISFNLGFHSLSHFYELFKSHYHMTPSAYRKKHKKAIFIKES